jgi:hypothetical protein
MSSLNASGAPWRKRLLSEVINRLHVSDAPAAFRKAGGRVASRRGFAFLLAACDVPKTASSDVRTRAIAGRFAIAVNDSILDAEADFAQLVDSIAAADAKALAVLCACRIIEDVEIQLEAAVRRSARPTREPQPQTKSAQA